MKITITLDEHATAQLADLTTPETHIEGLARNMVRDALAEFDAARSHASEGIDCARAYVDRRYPNPSSVYPSMPARERKALHTYDRCKLAQILKSCAVALETEET